MQDKGIHTGTINVPKVFTPVKLVFYEVVQVGTNLKFEKDEINFYGHLLEIGRALLNLSGQKANHANTCDNFARIRQYKQKQGLQFLCELCPQRICSLMFSPHQTNPLHFYSYLFFQSLNLLHL